MNEGKGIERAKLWWRNCLAFVGSFFQKRESHKITYRSWHHKTGLDVMLIRKQQLLRIRDCKAITGEYIKTEHKPVVFVARMNRTKQDSRPQDNQVVEMYIDVIAIEYRVVVKVKYEELGVEYDDVEVEWKKYKEEFVGNAEELCGISTGMGEKSRTITNGGQPK